MTELESASGVVYCCAHYDNKVVICMLTWVEDSQASVTNAKLDDKECVVRETRVMEEG